MRSPTNQLRPLRTKDAVVPVVLRVVTPLLAAVLAVGCSDRQDHPHVVLYVSADAHLARSVAAAFEAETGVRVDLVGDTELKKTTGLVERLRGERDHPQADVFWSSEIFMTIALADEGVLAPHDSEAVAGWPAEWRDADGRWFAFAARARVIVFAPERLAPAHVPETWTDLSHPRLRGRIAMADPRFGTTGGHLGAMKAFWERAAGPAYYEAFLIGLRDNEVRLLPGGNAG
ncbi:MAG: extracellular solute-binding protein, partial [Planctomycetota bacterium]|nr:extracellular solute-binding protein [Planctomycetota bacterium]